MNLNTVPQTIWKKPIEFIAYGFGSGAMPIAPGTFGTLASIPFYLLLAKTNFIIYLLILMISIFISFWICDVAEKSAGFHDHPGIVLDEFMGYGVTMIAAPKGIVWIILGFVLFRFFDIWKPQPIRWVNNNVMGGFGVVVDDLLAAIPAWVILQIIAYVFKVSKLF